MSSNTDGDKIFAFDVSKKLIDAEKKGNKISFLLEAISNSSSEIDFLSRESGQGPYLMICPTPPRPCPLRPSSSLRLPESSTFSRQKMLRGDKTKRDGSSHNHIEDRPRRAMRRSQEIDLA